ncbi:hypothetical protein EI77_00151 [Prosthecobacter fusiformis]|uniref:Yip1-like protein n=1 Tax=Prosthecobacter fusiformis TaxID=48464 RepID=A0A4V3FI29_9BACT|nr:hypothetical protein [Prosthecobacter fusiformis]TDU80853.1 hypothetical protein EI77_00151 [Prosthecobacter fusiformis]
MNTENTPPPLPTASNMTNNMIVEPMSGPVTLINVIENLLKHPGRLLHECRKGQLKVPLLLFLSTLISFSVFGLLLGSFSGGTQLWASPLKVTLGITAAVLICLPSLYIFSALDGLEARLGQIVVLILTAVALAGLLLLGFAPVIWVFSTSTNSLAFMGFLALIFWVIGLYFGSRLLLQAAQSQGMQSSAYLKTWLGIFVIVTLQMSTSLRPLLGTAETLLPKEKRFFIHHWFGNLTADMSRTR